MRKLNSKEQQRLALLEALARRVILYKRDLAERLAETRKLFARPVYAVDIHTHSLHSDGRGTVAENAERVAAGGLDFFFATDHASLRQKRALKRIRHAGWGQEPGTTRHHIGLLANTRLFIPRRDSVSADFRRARKLAPFVWIPHPTGWYPDTRYAPEQIRSLWQLGPAFAMEILNGACQAIRAYDVTDADTVRVWDRLLGDGRKVTAVAGSDAHLPFEIGSTWTGVFAARRDASAIIKALNQGLCFASEAPLLEFACNGRPMGSTLRVRPGAKLALRFRVADAAGIASVRIISQGRLLKEIRPGNRKLVEGQLARRASRQLAYYRLETTAGDDRRAFSTPIYVEPAV